MYLLYDNYVFLPAFAKVMQYYISAIQLPCGKKLLPGYFVAPLPHV